MKDAPFNNFNFLFLLNMAFKLGLMNVKDCNLGSSKLMTSNLSNIQYNHYFKTCSFWRREDPKDRASLAITVFLLVLVLVLLLVLLPSLIKIINISHVS